MANLAVLRPHQWLKNILIALPAIALHRFNPYQFIGIALAFVSFSLGASAIYLINDVLDLDHDRAHPTKCHRPIAAGKFPINHALFVAAILAIGALDVAVSLPVGFMLTLAGYLALAMAYSLYFKHQLMADVIVLAMLYGARVIAGAQATDIALSHWLIGFCFFLFLCLALVKRVTQIEFPSGRAYLSADSHIMISLMVASGFTAVLTLALYINSPDVMPLYRHPQYLWGICILLVYWLGRAFLLTARGKMHDDPVIFAATDRVSLLTGALAAGVFLVAL